MGLPGENQMTTDLIRTSPDDPRLKKPILETFQEFPGNDQLARTSGWVLVWQGDVVGSALVRENGNSWHLRRLAVLEKFRGFGHGAKILNSIKAEAIRQNVTELTTVTSKKWQVMRAMIQKGGWLFAGARKAKRSEGIEEHWFLPFVDKPIRLVLVGANPRGRGAELAETVARLPNLATLVGVCDPDPDTRIHWQNLGIPAAKCLEDFLRLGIHVEGVLLAVPHFAYEACREICFRHQLAMFHEKPLACSLAELQDLTENLGKHQVPLVVGTQRRDHPSYVYFRELIRNDSISAIVVSMELGKTVPHSSWRAERNKAGGGALIDLGFHAVDLVHFLLGKSIDLVSCSLWSTDSLGNARPVMEGELESEARIMGRCGNTWVKIIINQGGKKSEIVEAVGKHRWHCDRTAILRNGQPIFACEGDWELAISGRIGRFVLDLRKWTSKFESWDHFSSLRIIEQAYSMPSQIGLGKRIS